MTRCDVCLELVPHEAIWDPCEDVARCVDCYERIADRRSDDHVHVYVEGFTRCSWCGVER